ncbi:MAG: sialidase family protein, partial [Victivallales bacterium]
MKIEGVDGDWRQLENGLEIPTLSYSDQPYIVKTDDGAWLCCVTTGPGHEGVRGQHVTTMRSADKGRTWSTPVPVEAPDSPENSYAVMLKAPPDAKALGGGSSGRIYIFYNHNSDNVRNVKCHDGKGSFDRVDSLGHYVFKYSDDHGRSWSARRYDIPFRLFRCDRENVYGGKICFFWNVGKPFIHDGAAHVPLIKVGQMGEGFFQQSEGALLKSDNILFEKNPEKIRWETLPDGDIGLRTPADGGPISEEQSYVVLSDGSFYVNYRSIDGYPVESYSRDGGHTWSPPQYKCYADGKRMKNPRAANFVWKCTNGKYLYWFHNLGGHFIREMWGRPSETNGLVQDGGSPYDDRNPAWICGGVEADSAEGRIIRWSEPEILLYEDDPFVRISYPDLVEEDGKYFISETQKDTARVHEIPSDFVNRIWSGLEMSPGGKPDSADFT